MNAGAAPKLMTSARLSSCPPEIRGVPREPRQAPVKGVENHGQENEVGGGDEGIGGEELGPGVAPGRLGSRAATYIAPKPQTALPSVARLGRK